MPQTFFPTGLGPYELLPEGLVTPGWSPLIAQVIILLASIVVIAIPLSSSVDMVWWLLATLNFSVYWTFCYLDYGLGWAGGFTMLLLWPLHYTLLLLLREDGGLFVRLLNGGRGWNEAWIYADGWRGFWEDPWHWVGFYDRLVGETLPFPPRDDEFPAMISHTLYILQGFIFGLPSDHRWASYTSGDRLSVRQALVIWLWKTVNSYFAASIIWKITPYLYMKVIIFSVGLLTFAVGLIFELVQFLQSAG